MHASPNAFARIAIVLVMAGFGGALTLALTAEAAPIPVVAHPTQFTIGQYLMPH